MCKYSILSERRNARIRFCHDCETYSIVFNNLLLNFDRAGFEGFKEHLSSCYDFNVSTHCAINNDVRDITFNTRLEGLQFLFSTTEVGTLLALIQEAQLAEMASLPC